MPHEDGQFDQAILAELDDALDFLQMVVAREVAQKTADHSEAMRKLRLFSAIDLAGRCRRLWFAQPAITATEKYRSIASQIRQILSAWGDVPPQSRSSMFPRTANDKLYPLYLKARELEGGCESESSPPTG